MGKQHESHKNSGKKAAVRTPKEKKAFKKEKREANQESIEDLNKHGTRK
jgi:hypothetical protein